MKNKNLKILSFILTMVFMFSIAFNTVSKAAVNKANLSEAKAKKNFENITTEFEQIFSDAQNGKETLNVFRIAGNNRYQTSARLFIEFWRRRIRWMKSPARVLGSSGSGPTFCMNGRFFTSSVGSNFTQPNLR